MMSFLRSTLLLLYVSSLGFAQAPETYHSGKIIQMLEKLNTVGTVLYVAAHPDDENTQLISYFANGMNLRTGYLAATRGDGGQNLIGTEIRESLGVIRTQELLAARRTDGGEQFFARANDFGYSKDPDETFNKWDKEKVLADFVWVIRNFKPDVIVTRFNTTPKITHGHHTASAILAKEAFELSGDENAFPEQLDFVEPWQVKKIYWNTSTWFFRNSGETFDADKYAKIDVGGYDAALGESFTEISAKSRSMHKSQGFGRSGSRGTEYEYLEQWGGDKTKEIFDDMDFTWSRIEGGEEIQELIESAIFNFDPSAPESILSELLKIRKKVDKLEDDFWKDIKLKEIDDLIVAVTGTYIAFTSDASQYSPGEPLSIDMEIINRSSAPVFLSGVSFSRWSNNYIYNLSLANNQINEFNYQLDFSPRVPISNPYWLQEPWEEGMYTVTDQREIGKPENDPVVVGKAVLRIKDVFIECKVPVVYKTTDRVKGEIYKPISIVPKVMVNIDQKALVYVNDQPKNVPVTVIAGTDELKGILTLNLPDGWKSKPDKVDFELLKKGEEKVFDFMVTPSKAPGEFTIGAVAEIDGQSYDKARTLISYDHIPEQVWFPKSETRAVKLDLNKEGKLIGYIMGAGDEVPYSLEQMGYQVDLLEKEQVDAKLLEQYDAVVVGIRAFNTLDWLSYKNTELFQYAADGGTVLVQYNTYGTVTDQIAPYNLKISRDRVTVEQAEVRLLDKKNPVLNYPNKITSKDFEGWVQERGLYFPNEWADEFKPVLSMNDPDEKALESSLLIAKYGEGYYIYSGISFFRELPAGVPGAFRLLANLLSVGNQQNEN